ncbi:hypothetical protein JHK82_039441 [Glycine max]|uniref:Uncharacterized protein n=2 Tax=Glycine subgen. Soja TaxID=1462606 RepID=A0A0R0GC86_SOYBN|nr:hypothetical protein JHK87_039418 [Glycine soja]KAG4962755.1 hypothetical protein JHK86_039623 [Glycine max]KAG4965223.1 hypothetical protein JHK85_040198 [Glycine max]KAG5110218.1 hypothetical protein JHK82_039441 [Glycine max]KAG5121506.1 hypothetical protein JHK84_039846 [Glycine max]
MIDASVACLPSAPTSLTLPPPFQHRHCPDLVLPSFFSLCKSFFFSKVFSNARPGLRISFVIFFFDYLSVMGLISYVEYIVC